MFDKILRRDPASKIVNALKDLVIRPFGDEHQPLPDTDRLWREWVNSKRDGLRHEDLRPLIAKNVRDEFKRRAIAVLMAPDVRLIPFIWRKEEQFRSFLTDFNVDLPALSKQLQRYTGELICLYLDLLNAEPPKVENYILSGLIRDYGKYLYWFLVHLPETDELYGRSFERFLDFCVRDYWAHDSHRDPPLQRFLSSDKFSKRQKELVYRKMREVAIAEAEGKLRPPQLYGGQKDALGVYIDCVLPFFMGERGLTAPEVEFVLGISTSQGRCLFAYNLKATLKRLEGSEHRELRHRLVRYALLDTPKNKTSSRAFEYLSPAEDDEQSESFARKLLAEFAYDADIVDYLKHAFLRHEEDDRKYKKRKEEFDREQAQYDDLMEKMK